MSWKVLDMLARLFAHTKTSLAVGFVSITAFLTLVFHFYGRPLMTDQSAPLSWGSAVGYSVPVAAFGTALSFWFGSR